MFNVDKPWENEPDHIIFNHNGLMCEVKRNMHFGHLCGYVYVPTDHPWYNIDYNNIDDVDVHGGITYGEKNKFGYAVGFDCFHFGDMAPYSPYFTGGYYCDMFYLLNQCESLAEQASEVGLNDPWFSQKVDWDKSLVPFGWSDLVDCWN